MAVVGLAAAGTAVGVADTTDIAGRRVRAAELTADHHPTEPTAAELREDDPLVRPPGPRTGRRW